MIPYCPMALTPRRARVTNVGLPTEKHGDHKRAFVDIKLELLLTRKELDEWMGSVRENRPTRHLFNEGDHNSLWLPDVVQYADLRPEIEGDLDIEIGQVKLNLEGAHTVGSVNRLRFKPGGHGELVLQFRVPRPTGKNMDAIIEAVERGDCMVTFTESEESATTGKTEAQDEMSL